LIERIKINEIKRGGKKMDKKKKIIVFLQGIKWRWFWFFLEERCVLPLCRGRTGVLKKTPINQREYYIEGSGQLCENCYRKIYK
jgi:hypothetical protein